jgi:hypothetical protein
MSRTVAASLVLSPMCVADVVHFDLLSSFTPVEIAYRGPQGASYKSDSTINGEEIVAGLKPALK